MTSEGDLRLFEAANHLEKPQDWNGESCATPAAQELGRYTKVGPENGQQAGEVAHADHFDFSGAARAFGLCSFFLFRQMLLHFILGLAASHASHPSHFGLPDVAFATSEAT